MMIKKTISISKMRTKAKNMNKRRGKGNQGKKL
jgi:hypothetical protein